MKNFSVWQKWNERNNISGKNYPGIYCIAISKSNLSEKEFSWIPEIKYIGMTNSIKGLKGRLYQFDHTIFGKSPSHGGADRFRFEYENYEKLTKQLFVSVCSFECDVKSNLPKDLKIMGSVCKFEFDCFAKYVEEFGSLPKFNDKKNSPKYSLTHR